MIWKTEFAIKIMPQIMQGMWITIQATAMGGVLALTLGLVLALSSRSKFKPLSWTSNALTEIFRRTPLLIHLYFLFYALPEIGIVLSPVTAGLLALGMQSGSYMAAVYQSGIDAVPEGQWEAAKALGYSPLHTWTKIIFPQAIPITIPSLGNYLLLMFKESAILSVIAVPEAMQTAMTIGARSYRYFEAVTIVGLMYLSISLVIAVVLRLLEKKLVVIRH